LQLASDAPAVADLWQMLVAGVSRHNSLSREDVQLLGDSMLGKLADIFNLPRRQLANGLNNAKRKHVEL